MEIGPGISFGGGITASIQSMLQLLVVGGGAAGAGNGGNYTTGGGGAGGLIWVTVINIIGTGTYTVTVGAGGIGNGTFEQGRLGNQGTASSVSGTNTSMNHTAGSGFGGAYGFGGNQGTNDGVAGNTGYAGTSGGGGGAGGAGGVSNNRNGGAARLISELNGITGYNNTGYFAGGGAGYNGSWGTTTGGGGINGNGGAANTGSGGSPNSFNNGNGGSGGSGIVVIRYADTFAAAISTTGSPTITNAGGYRTYTFTASGSITF